MSRYLQNSQCVKKTTDVTASLIISPLSNSLSKFDRIAQGAVEGKFSALEAARALKEAKLCLEIMSEVRRYLISGINQILNSTS
jgi:hypothetical protein